MGTQVSDADYMTSLEARVKELEAENANLLARLAHCHCSPEDQISHSPDYKDAKVNEPKKIQRGITKEDKK
ncbi:unnamed protein product [Lathyrus sativus]|nr:unnamed protein product [Lathyrus sativus]